MVNFPIRIPDCDSHSPAYLDLFLSSDASIFSTMAFPLLWSFEHVVSVSIDFPSNPKGDVPFHLTAYAYSRANWEGIGDNSRDILWEDIFKTNAWYWILGVGPR